MKKHIAAILVFVFCIQTSTQTFAQSDPIAQKKELMKCYDQFFDQSSKALTESTGKEIILDSNRKLEYLRMITYRLMNNISKNEISDAENLQTAAMFLGSFAVGGVMVAGTRYFVNRPLVNEYNDLKQLLRSKQLTVEEIMETRIIPRANYLSQEIAYKAGTGRYLAKSWIVLMVALFAITVYFYETKEDFSQDFEKTSIFSLLFSTSVEDFENQLFISNDPTSLEIGKKLLKSCHSLVKQDINKTLKSFENFSESELIEAVNWLQHSSK